NLVEGFKTDQKEIESAIVRTLAHLDELEDATTAAKKPDHNGRRQAPEAPSPSEPPAPERHAERTLPERPAVEPSKDEPTTKDELDIF
ncbi:MAG TPA: hypothetical protein VL354_14065, partial [Spirochaetia bacterium]|nr:hypothetical protein [Spirochaetia bacterium]